MRRSKVKHRSSPPVVLVVDDDDDFRALAAESLRAAGYTVVEAAGGGAAIEQARAILPRAILLDLEMPQIDGCAVARVLKADASTSHIPIVAFTGSSGCERARALAACCEAFLEKPATSEVIAAVVARVISSGKRDR